MANLNVSQLIEAVKKEIVAAEQRARQDQNGMFELEQLELEIKFTVSQEEGGKAGLDVVVASAGVDTTRKSEEVQTVTLLFKAVKKRPDGSLVDGESAAILGAGRPFSASRAEVVKPRGPVVKPRGPFGGGRTKL